jgi:hypothetical protein
MVGNHETGSVRRANGGQSVNTEQTLSCTGPTTEDCDDSSKTRSMEELLIYYFEAITTKLCEKTSEDASGAQRHSS